MKIPNMKTRKKTHITKYHKKAGMESAHIATTTPLQNYANPTPKATKENHTQHAFNVTNFLGSSPSHISLKTQIKNEKEKQKEKEKKRKTGNEKKRGHE